MNADEKAIIEYLRGWPFSYLSGKEIARKVGGRKRFEKEPSWATALLQHMVREGFLETDQQGHFRLTQAAAKKKRSNKHVSPQFLRILKSSGRSFEGIVIDEDEDNPDNIGKPIQPKPEEEEKKPE